MMRVAVLAALLLSFPAAGQTLEYAGHVSISTTACAGLKSWHYQCLPRVWVPIESVQPSDVVAVCMGQGANDSETVCANVNVNRRWVARSALTEDSVVLVCTVMGSSGCATAKYLSADGVTTPPVDPEPEDPVDPIPDPEPEPIPVTGISFVNVTASVVAIAPTVNTNFWAGLPDVNRDGCLDAFIGTHSDTALNSNTASAMYIQGRNESGCSGTFTYRSPLELGYTQAAAVPRISSRYMWGNWYGDPDGLWSFFGHDVDGSPSARYPVLGLGIDGAPLYGAKSTACGTWTASKMFCLPVSLSTDGTLQLATRVRSTGTPAIGVLRSITSPGTVLTSPTPPLPYANAHALLDVDGDGFAEILVPALGGYLKWIAGDLVWQADKFIGNLPDVLAADNHFAALDYDADGDMDFYAGYGTYSDASGTVPHTLIGASVFYPMLYRNNGDGSFTDVNEATGLVGELKNRYYHTTYANAVVADINLDGYPDLIHCGESLGHGANGTYVALAINDGDGSFTVDRSINFGAFNQDNESNGGGRPWCNAGDYDGDGRVDLIKTAGRLDANHNSLGLWRNVSNVSDNNWLIVTASGAGVNTDGLGASIVVRVPDSNIVITSTQIGVTSTGHQNLLPHMGVSYHDTVDLDIVLPNSLGSCHFRDVATNARYHVSNSCVLGAK